MLAASIYLTLYNILPIYTLAIIMNRAMLQCPICFTYLQTEMDFQNHYKSLHERLETSDDTDTVTDNASDSGVLINEEISFFQRTVYNAEIRKKLLTKRTLRNLLNFKHLEKAMDSESESDNDSESDTESEQSDTWDSEINDAQLQVLRTILKAAKKKVFKLTRDIFISIIDSLKFE